MKLDSYHPYLLFLYFGTVIVTTIYFNQPLFLIISFLFSMLYSIKCTSSHNKTFYILTLLFIPLHTAWYAAYHHFGVTSLGRNCIGNQITLESIVFGLVQSIIVISVLYWINCMSHLFTSDKVIYLFGKILPKVSLLLAILFRMIPCVRERAKKIHLSQSLIGKGCMQGNLFCRAKNACRFVSILVTWTIDNFMESANSMKSRGYGGRGRTAYAIYRFDNRDRVIVILICFFITIFLSGAILGVTFVSYNPEILLQNKWMGSSFIGIFYAVYCSLPLLAEYR